MADIGNVEKIPNIIKKPYLAFLHRKALAQDNHPIGALALRWLIVELCHMFPHHPNVPISFLNNDCFLHICRPPALLAADTLLLATSEYTPAFAVKAFGDFDQVRHRVDPKGKSNPLLRPAIKMHRQGKIRIPPQTHPIKTLSHQFNGPIHPPNRTIMGDLVARTVHQVQRFHRVGQGDQKRVVTPLSLMRKAHALLTLTPGRCVGSVHIDDRFFALTPGKTFLPQLGPNAVDGLHQLNDIFFAKPPGEVPGRGRVRNALNSQAIHEYFIVAPQFNIIKAGAPAKRIVGYVQNMVRFMIRKVPLQKVHFLINGIRKAAVTSQQMKSSDSTTFNRSDSLCHFIVNIFRSQKRFVLLRPLSALKTFRQFLFTLFQYSGIFGLHSKCSSLRLDLLFQKRF